MNEQQFNDPSTKKRVCRVCNGGGLYRDESGVSDCWRCKGEGETQEHDDPNDGLGYLPIG